MALEDSGNPDNRNCTSDSFLDVYANRNSFSNKFPGILKTNFMEFATKYKLANNKLEQRNDNIIPIVFPIYSSSPKGKWKNSLDDAWGTTEPNNQTFITEWHNFLNTPYAKKHVQDWSQKISDVLENIELQNYENSNNQEIHEQEEWMILSEFYKSSQKLNNELPNSNYDWTIDSMKYTAQQIGEMPSWIVTLKENFQPSLTPTDVINVESFSEMQKLAYDIITKHSKNSSEKEALLLIIKALKSYLKQKCVITATTGKAAYNIRGVTVHSLLKLPTCPQSKKDLSGESLIELQERLSNTDYILIDEYSMLGQRTLGWIDKRCRQSSGAKENLFGGKSIILIGDPAQLSPVSDKPLFHAKPSNQIGSRAIMLT